MGDLDCGIWVPAELAPAGSDTAMCGAHNARKLHRVTCSPSLKGRGFSVQGPSHGRDSPKGLPGPLDISGRILVAVHRQPTGGTDMGAHRERLIDPLPTDCSIRADIGAILGGERRRYRFHSLASVCCFAGEDTAEGIPSGVLNAFVEARLSCGPRMQIAALAIGNP